MISTFSGNASVWCLLYSSEVYHWEAHSATWGYTSIYYRLTSSETFQCWGWVSVGSILSIPHCKCALSDGHQFLWWCHHPWLQPRVVGNHSWIYSCTFPLSSEYINVSSIYALHWSFLHLVFLYIDLCHAIYWEDGPEIIRHWKMWIPQFLGVGFNNYAVEAANFIANLSADFPKHLSYIATNNRTVNMQGKPGHWKPIDQLIEHYIL